MAWTFQDPKQLAKHGPKKASWYVGWFEPGGGKRCKSCGPGSAGKDLAEKLKRKREAELITGTYQAVDNRSWAEFRAEFNEKILAAMDIGTRRLTREVLVTFERIVNPKKMAAVVTGAIDRFIGKRRLEPGRRKGDTLSPATVNKDLRHLKAVLKVAQEWGYLAEVPRFRMLKEPGQLPTYVSPEHFAAMYQACDKAKRPKRQPYPPADWWRALLVFAYMTGWRIGEILAVRREDLDLEAGTVITWHEDNKGRRDERVKLHPVIVEHLQKLTVLSLRVFPWPHSGGQLYVEFGRIQVAAGVKLPCNEKHEHTPGCHVYGFHDLRRAFATMNASRLSANSLQALMRHKNYATTQRYINMARRLDEVVDVLHVPEVLKTKGAGG